MRRVSLSEFIGFVQGKILVSEKREIGRHHWGDTYPILIAKFKDGSIVQVRSDLESHDSDIHGTWHSIKDPEFYISD